MINTGFRVIQSCTVGQHRSHRLLLPYTYSGHTNSTSRVVLEIQVLSRVTARTALQHTGRIITEQEMFSEKCEKCQRIFLAMYIKHEQVLGLSSERGVHRQNAQLIDTDFLSFKVLAAQMSISLADRAVCQLLGISTFSVVIL